jgi:hypothetical protein
VFYCACFGVLLKSLKNWMIDLTCSFC